MRSNLPRSDVTVHFSIGDLKIEGDLVLAPMDGVTDQPFRLLARKLGSALSYTEFINAMDVVRGNSIIQKRIAYSQEERPVVFQLFDDDPDRILQAAVGLQKLQPDIIDINMGCPAKTVSGRGAGAALMRAPEKVKDIFSRLSKHLKIPVTGKIRLGWDESSRNFLEIARIIEGEGGKCIAVHARTKEQGYTGAADWDAIGLIKQTVSIPVIGNGDVRSSADIDRMKTTTGCDGVMIGRASVENPWLFSRLDRELVSAEVVLSTMETHYNLMAQFHGADLALLLFRKFAKGYLKPYQLSRFQIGTLLTTTSTELFWGQVRQIVLAFANP